MVEPAFKAELKPHFFGKFLAHVEAKAGAV